MVSKYGHVRLFFSVCAFFIDQTGSSQPSSSFPFWNVSFNVFPSILIKTASSSSIIRCLSSSLAVNCRGFAASGLGSRIWRKKSYDWSIYFRRVFTSPSSSSLSAFSSLRSFLLLFGDLENISFSSQIQHFEFWAKIFTTKLLTWTWISICFYPAFFYLSPYDRFDDSLHSSRFYQFYRIYRISYRLLLEFIFLCNFWIIYDLLALFLSLSSSSSVLCFFAVGLSCSSREARLLSFSSTFESFSAISRRSGVSLLILQFLYKKSYKQTAKISGKQAKNVRNRLKFENETLSERSTRAENTRPPENKPRSPVYKVELRTVFYW